MTATMTNGKTKLVDGFDMVKIERSDSAVHERLYAFLKRYDLPLDTEPMGENWFAFRKDGRIVLVTGWVSRKDGSIEITDFYPVPSKDGIKAGHLALEFVKALVHAGKIPYFVFTCAWKNTYAQRHANKLVGEPACVVYCYNGGANAKAD